VCLCVCAAGVKREVTLVRCTPLPHHPCIHTKVFRRIYACVAQSISVCARARTQNLLLRQSLFLGSPHQIQVVKLGFIWVWSGRVHGHLHAIDVLWVLLNNVFDNLGIPVHSRVAWSGREHTRMQLNLEEDANSLHLKVLAYTT